ncbi:MAG TPA: hypothetical protein VE781_12400 [Kineosporiaceae bacterium]|nr:hypothetical protein [Kineosporiaceae bacterium]
MNDPDLARLLERALHETLDGDPVDVITLAARTRRRARRRSATRPARVVLTCAAAATVAIAGIGSLRSPVGATLFRPDGPAVVVTTPPATATGTTFRIPASVGFAPGELPAGLELLTDKGDEPEWPLITDQVCDSSKGTAGSVAARRVRYFEDKPARSVDLIVTGYPKRTGSTAFDAFTAQSGACTWLRRPTQVSARGLHGDDVWVGTTQGEGRVGGIGYAVVRYGDVIVSVTVRGRDLTPTQATASATRLVQVAADRARDQIPQAQS